MKYLINLNHTSDLAEKKSVRLDNITFVFHFVKFKRGANSNENKLLIMVKSYRQFMDGQAKMKELSFAAGHNSLKDRYKCYDHNFAILDHSKLQL